MVKRMSNCVEGFLPPVLLLPPATAAHDSTLLTSPLLKSPAPPFISHPHSYPFHPKLHKGFIPRTVGFSTHPQHSSPEEFDSAFIPRRIALSIHTWQSMSSSIGVPEFRSQEMESLFPEFGSSIVGSMARGKRSKRSRPSYSEEDHVFSDADAEAEEEAEQQQLAAYSLMMIAHAHGISSGGVRFSGPSKRKSDYFEAVWPEMEGVKEQSEKMYHCKSCSKKFMSFQALGGHRASCHNKTRILQGGFDEEHVAASLPKERLHICPICDRVFTSGQALGGHKRTHSTPSTSVSHPAVSPLRSSSVSTIKSEQQLDLNMPAPFESIDSPVAPAPLTAPRFSKPNYTFKPYWWMESPARSAKPVYDGGMLVAAEDEARRDLGFKQDLFLVATVN